MSDNLSQEEIDALLGVQVESVIDTPKEGEEAPAADGPDSDPGAGGDSSSGGSSGPAASGDEGFLDDMARGIAEAFFRDCIGNAYEDFSEILNVTTEFKVGPLEELTLAGLTSRYSGENLIHVQGSFTKPMQRPVALFLRQDEGFTLGDILMGSDGSEPSADMKDSYLQALTEGFRRFFQKAVCPHFGDLIGVGFDVDMLGALPVLLDGTTDAGLGDEVVSCEYVLSCLVQPPEGKCDIRLRVAVPRDFIEALHPEKIADIAQQPGTAVPAPAVPASAEESAAMDIAPPPMDMGSSLAIDQNDVDSLLAQVQAAMVPEPQAAQPVQTPQQQVQFPQQQSAQPQQQGQQPMAQPGQVGMAAATQTPGQPVAQQQTAIGEAGFQQSLDQQRQQMAQFAAQQSAIGQAGFQDAAAFEQQRQMMNQQGAGAMPQQPGMQPQGMYPQQPAGMMGSQGPQGWNPQQGQQPMAPMQGPGGWPQQDPAMAGWQQGGYPPMSQMPPQQPPQGWPQQPPQGNLFTNQGVMNPQQVQKVNFAPLTFTQGATAQHNMELLLDVPLQITVELGRTRMLIKEILELAEGSIVELDKIAGESIDLMVNNKLVAKGEVVVIDENFGIRITAIVSQQDRLANII